MASEIETSTEESKSSKSLISRAADLLHHYILDGYSDACERVLEAIPELRSDRESLLELIYLEHIHVSERNAASEPNSNPVAERRSDAGLKDSQLEGFLRRFPELDGDLQKLFDVAKVIGTEKIDSHLDYETPRFQKSQSDFASNHPLEHLRNYDLLEEIGRGGTGVVYKAKQKGLERIVAIKMPNAWNEIGRSTMDRFRKEAELASNLHHPHIAPIYEVGVSDGIPFYSMEYIEGGSLAKFLDGNLLPPRTASQLLIAVSQAVDYAHSMGVLHRDLKPGNILLDSSGRTEALFLTAGKDHDNQHSIGYEPKIVDFGLAIEIQQPSDGSIRRAGTPSYMAPEQIDPSFGDLGPHSDVYALGSVLYHALTGRPPFSAATSEETMEQVCNAEVTSLRAIRTRVPRDLEAICLKCLRKKPCERYGTAQEFSKDLLRFLEGKCVSARKWHLLDYPFKWSLRHPTLALSVLLLIAAMSLTTWLWRKSELSLASERIAKEQREQLAYDREIALAYHEFRSLDTLHAKELLLKTDSHRRNWEWKYIDGLCNQFIWESPLESSEGVFAVAIDPEGKKAAIGHGTWGKDRDQVIPVWDIDSNKKLFELRGHPRSSISNIEFSPNGKSLLTSAIVWETGKVYGKVIEWDANTGEKKREIANVNANVAKYCKSGDGVLVGDVNGKICLYRTSGEAVVQEFNRHKGMVLSISVSSDNKIFASSGRDGTLSIWDIDSGTELSTHSGLGDPRSVAWTPDTKKLYTCYYDGKVDQYNWDGAQLVLARTDTMDQTHRMAFSPDGRTYASAVYGDGAELKLTETGKTIAQFPGHRGAVRVFGFDKFGHRLITGGADGVCRVWDLTLPGTTNQKLSIGGATIAAIAFRPHSNELAVAITRTPTQSLPANKKPRVEIYDTNREALSLSIEGHRSWLTTVAYSPDGTRLATGSLDKTVRVVDSDSGKLVCSLEGHHAAIRYLGFANDKSIVSVDAAGNAIQWDLSSMNAVRTWRCLKAKSMDEGAASHAVVGSLHSISGRLAVAQGKSLTIWDIKSESIIHEMELGFPISCVQFDTLGRHFAIAVESEEQSNASVEVWEIRPESTKTELKMQLRFQLPGIPNNVTSISFSADGSRMASASSDETVRVFGMELGSELLKLQDGLGEQRSLVVAFNSDSSLLARGDRSDLRLFRTNNPDKFTSSDEVQRKLRWHTDQYYSSARSLDINAAIFHARYVVNNSPDDTNAKLRLIELLMMEDHLKEAKELLLTMEDGPDSDLRQRLLLARVHLLLGEIVEYRFVCQDAFNRISRNKHSRATVTELGWVLSLNAGSGVSSKKIVALLEKSLTGARSSTENCTLALTCYRAGLFEKSIIAAQKSASSDKLMSMIAIKTMSRNRLLQNQAEAPSETNKGPKSVWKQVLQGVDSTTQVLHRRGMIQENLYEIARLLQEQSDQKRIGIKPTYEQQRYRKFNNSILLTELQTEIEKDELNGKLFRVLTKKLFEQRK